MTKEQHNSEQELLKRLLQRNSVARKELYDQYSGFLTAVCSRYISNIDDVNDVLQESFIKIFTSIQQFNYRGEGSLKAWMTKIVINESLKHLRDVQRVSFVSPTLELPDIADEIEPEFDNIHIQIIMDLIRKLPTGYRTVFNLYVFEKKSHREIAQALNITESSSASQLHRAKAMLANWIKAFETQKQLQNG